MGQDLKGAGTLKIQNAVLPNGTAPTTGATEGALFVSDGTGGLTINHLYFRPLSNGTPVDLQAGGGSSLADGTYLTYNADVTGDGISTFDVWADLQVVAAAIEAAGGTFRLWFKTSLVLPAGTHLIGEGFFCRRADAGNQIFITIPEGCVLSTTCREPAFDGAFYFNVTATTTYALTIGVARIRVHTAQFDANGGWPMFFFTDTGEGAQPCHVDSTDGIFTVGPMFEADTGIDVNVYMHGPLLTVGVDTFKSADVTTTLTFFRMDPTVIDGRIQFSVQTVWSGPVLYSQNYFKLVEQTASDGGTSRASDATTERTLATLTVPGGVLDKVNRIGRLSVGLRCTAQSGVVTAQVRVRWGGTAGVLLYDFGGSVMVSGGFAILELKMRTATRGSSGTMNVWGMASISPPFDGVSGAMGSFSDDTPTGIDYTTSKNLVVTIQYSANDGGLNAVRCDGASFDVGDSATGLP